MMELVYVFIRYKKKFSVQLSLRKVSLFSPSAGLVRNPWYPKVAGVATSAILQEIITHICLALQGLGRKYTPPRLRGSESIPFAIAIRRRRW